ncbi:hypothetical protein [Gorillibacterium sp. CAU 1737]|uniref:hypothetical protein n=1 Tax=Gorillibacterium sp. CAU 1737 TaxID=3140362 RepID=UPI003261402F
MFKLIMSRLLTCVLITSIALPAATVNAASVTAVAASSQAEEGSITILVINPDSRQPVPGLHLYIDGKDVGTTDKNGTVFLDHLKLGHYEVELRLAGAASGTMNGFYVTGKESQTELWYSGPTPSQSTTSSGSRFQQTVVNVAPSLPTAARDTKITVSFDSSIPASTQAYIKKLAAELDPAVRSYLGAPIKSGNLMLKYAAGSHTTISQDKAVMTFGKLPDGTKGTDKAWDEIFLVNYIHKFLDGGSIPIPGIRYTENLAHSIKELVAESITAKGTRTIAYRGINYYLAAYPAFQSLKPELVLNTGNTNDTASAFKSDNFLLTNNAYDKLNSFTIEYAKAVWLKLAYARYLESGQWDFFYQLKEQLVQKKPQDRAGFEAIITSLVPVVAGKTAVEWMSEQALFRGSIPNKLAVSLFVADGDSFNVTGRNNPDMLYPFVISRTPGEIIHTDVKVTVKNSKGNVILNQTGKSGYSDNGKTGIRLPQDKLTPGTYTATAEATYQGTTVKDTQTFTVYSADNTDGYWLNLQATDTSRNTKVTVTYDASIPAASKSYIDLLMKDIDPVIRQIAGAPQADNRLVVKYDPKGLAGMDSNMTVLNLVNLPKAGSKTDANFDSFFFIEYYHMFHKGTTIPIANARYTENISQAMKIVISHTLKQNGIRDTNVQSIPYYLHLNKVLENLGPGVLINLGRTNGNAGSGNLDVRTEWKDTSAYMMGMNVFTLEYGPTPWLVLADAYFKRNGDYGFFRELQNELAKKAPASAAEFYTLIDSLVPAKIEGKKASDWLKGTALFQEVPKETTFVKPLPIQGTSRLIYGMDNPDAILPFAVSRKGAAEIIEQDYTVSVVNEKGKIVFTQKGKPALDGDMGLPKAVKLPKLAVGKYKAVLAVVVDGKTITGEQAFAVTQ